MTDDPGLDAIMSERRQLIDLGYRLTGSLADAEDVVQETYARWYAMSEPRRAAIVSPGAWLTRVAGRICLDLLGSARKRREGYVGEWIPEPLPDHSEWAGGGPGGATADPAERVAFILHDVFGYPFAEVAETVGRTPAACRQLASSARRRINASRTAAAPPARQAAIVRDFRRAWEARDIDALIGILDPAATAVGDGGGRAGIAVHPIEGGARVARYALTIAGRVPDLTLLERTVNGRPGLVGQQGGVTTTVIAFEVAGDRITRLWAVRNPDKLHPWTD